jgi:hypothetical protein
MPIILWQIYCNSEAAWVQGLLDQSAGPPVVCFNNNTHSVNKTTQQQLNITAKFAVKILQEDIPTGGHYSAEGFLMNIAPLAKQVLSVSWPFPTTTNVVHLQPAPENFGDTLDAIVSPRTLIGTITANIPIGGVTVGCSTTVIANCQSGFEFYVGNEHLGRIITVNNNSITFEKPAIFAHTNGETVYTELTIIRNLQLAMTNGNDLGISSIGGKSLPAYTVTNVVYTNKSADAKKFRFMIEHLF